MARKSSRQSQVDRFMKRVAYWAIGVFALLAAVSVLISEQPLIALGVAILLVGIPSAIWYQRRANRKKEALFHLHQAQQLGQLLTVSGSEFEEIVADLFRALGYRNVKRIGKSGDLGVDLFAIDQNGLQVIVQCKRYGRGQKIGSPDIQKLMGSVVNQGVDRGIFVTTSTFTTPAVQAATSGRVAIDLVDGGDLTRLAEGVGMRPELITS